MTDDDAGMTLLRRTLVQAERDRDAAVAETESLRRRSQDERREEQHRLRNLFSVIRAIAQRTADEVDTVEDYRGVLDGRLSAYLNVQAVLGQDGPGGADLAMLVAGALQAFGVKEGERVELDGPSVRLTGRAAGVMALAFHELAFGVVMSDGIAVPTTSLRVTWRLAGGDRRSLAMEWVETAAAGDGDEDAPSSWADWVEQAIQYQLAGTLTTEAGDAGRTVRIILPAAALC